MGIYVKRNVHQVGDDTDSSWYHVVQDRLERVEPETG
jgi:hypothetical protein